MTWIIVLLVTLFLLYKVISQKKEIKRLKIKEKIHLDLKKYDYGGPSPIFYVTLNGDQILGAHFSERSAKESIQNMYSGINSKGEKC